MVVKKDMAKNKNKASLDDIECPKCGASIPLSETLQQKLTEKTRQELERENAKVLKAISDKEKELKTRETKITSAQKNMKQLVEDKVNEEKKKIEKEALKTRQELEQEHIKTLKAISEKEKELKNKEKEIDAAQKNMDQLVEDKVNEEKKKLEQDALKKAKASLAIELKDLNEQIKEKDNNLKLAQDNELEMRKQKRELEQKQKEFELEMARKIDEERETIKEDAIKRTLEEHSLKDAEREKQLRDALKANEELHRKLEQGSQQNQGEVFELKLEDVLKTKFPLDTITPIRKGMTGADILQKICNQSGLCCGTIAWEAKNAKNWSDSWISKLKDDQMMAKADVAILITTVLPKDVKNFIYVDGIWVTNYDSLYELTTVLRLHLIQLSVTKSSMVNKNEKMEVLYSYLSGPEFRQKIETIIRGFTALQQDLNKEKRIYAKMWAKREKEIERVIQSTSGMYGDMQGLIGSSMHSIPALELTDDENDGSKDV